MVEKIETEDLTDDVVPGEDPDWSHVPRTGRLSSANPNVSNRPKSVNYLTDRDK